MTHRDDLLKQAREVGPSLRASNVDQLRLAGWVLVGLADEAERSESDERIAREREVYWRDVSLRLAGWLAQVSSHNDLGPLVGDLDPQTAESWLTVAQAAVSEAADS